MATKVYELLERSDGIDWPGQLEVGQWFLGQEAVFSTPSDNFVVITSDLWPKDTVRLIPAKHTKCIGTVTEDGNFNMESHAVTPLPKAEADSIAKTLGLHYVTFGIESWVYQLFQHIAEERGVIVKTVIREALTEYAAQRRNSV